MMRLSSSDLVAAVKKPGSNFAQPRGPPAKAGPHAKSESMSLLNEMKLKQEQRDKRRNLKQEIDKVIARGLSSDLMKLSHLRTQLSAVESFLAQTDGAQSLQADPAPAPMAPQDYSSDMETTNLYVGSVAPEWTEEMLYREFAQFGEITSIKIMYPRTEQQRLRGMNSGFVQFATRKQAETCMRALNGKEYFRMPLRIDWGRAVQTAGVAAPTHPTLQPHIETPRLALPGQPGPGQVGNPQGLTPVGQDAVASGERKSRWNKAKTLTVGFPESKSMKFLIDKTAEFVAVEGWDFEKMLREREESNPRFAFLNNQDPDAPLHVYYRWRAFSFAQGDTSDLWRIEPFQIYDNGPLWQPPECEQQKKKAEAAPALQLVTSMDMPSIAVGGEFQKGSGRGTGGVGGGGLRSEDQCYLEEIITTLSPERSAVLKALAFCLDNAGASQFISLRIFSSIVDVQPGLTTAQLTGRLYLLNDVLFNSRCSRPGASTYRRQFQEFLPDIFERLREICDGISPIAASSLRDRVIRLVRTWAEWSSFTPQFTRGLEATLCRDRSKSSGDSSGADGDNQDRPALLAKQKRWAHQADDATTLERECRIRGISTRGTRQMLVERLSGFEAYWHDADVEAAAKEAKDAKQAQDDREAKFEASFVDPELDGVPLQDGDLPSVDENNFCETAASSRCTIDLLGVNKEYLGSRGRAITGGTLLCDNESSVGATSDVGPVGDVPETSADSDLAAATASPAEEHKKPAENKKAKRTTPEDDAEHGKARDRSREHDRDRDRERREKSRSHSEKNRKLAIVNKSEAIVKKTSSRLESSRREKSRSRDRDRGRERSRSRRRRR